MIHSRLVTTLFIPALLVGSQSLADEQEDLSRTVQFCERATTIKDLLTAVEERKTPNTQFVRNGVWYVAAHRSTHPRFQSDTGFQRQVVNLTTYATLLELANAKELDRWPRDEKLHEMGKHSLKALYKIANFGAPTDPINRVLAHKPTIKDGWHDVFHGIQFDLHHRGIALRFERSDTRIGDITERWQLTERRAIRMNPKRMPAGEAREFHFPLKTLKLLVVASKACLSISVLPDDIRVTRYARIVLANALYHNARVFVNDHALRPAALAAPFFLTKAIDSLQKNPERNGTQLTSDGLQPRLGSMYFVARQWESAADAYRAALKNSRSAKMRVYLRIRLGMALLGAGGKSAEQFRLAVRLASRLETESSWWRFKLSSLNESLPKMAMVNNDKESQDALEQWKAQIYPMELRNSVIRELVEELSGVGLHAAVSNLLMREIRYVRTLTNSDANEHEFRYLQELFASQSEGFELLSWERHAKDGTLFQPRGVENATLRMDEWMLDFAPIKDDARVVLGDRYGRRSPEEDRATCAEFYRPEAFEPLWKKMIQEAKPDELMHLLKNKERNFAKHPEKAFADWVSAELGRNPPNVEPLLKMAWVEWFLVPGSELGKPYTDDWSWEYKPIAGLAQRRLRESLRRIASQNEIAPESVGVAKTFRSVHEFLIKHYGHKERDGE